MTSESITVSIATTKCGCVMKSAGAVEVSVCAIRVVVAIYKRSAMGTVDVAVINDRAMMPVRSPVIPSPSEPAKESDWITYAKQNSRRGNEQSGIPIPPRPSHERRSINHPGIVFGNVNNFGIAWRDHNCLSLLGHIFLWSTV